jgi:two-component system sensor histidine kinase UhpB
MRKDGKRIYTLLSPKPIYDDIGQLRGSVSVLTDISARREVEKELNKSREQLRNLSQYLQSVREKESTRIAREIHDELGQHLTALKMDLSILSRLVLSNEEEQKKFLNKLNEMSKLIDSTIHTVQKISAELRPGLLDDLGLIPALEWLSQDFQNRLNIDCKLHIDCNDIGVDPDLATAIFRISQEALTNVVRHANASKVSIRLREIDGKLELRISDNGKGISENDVFSASSLGLMGMRERLHPFGGELRIDGIPQVGTTLIAILPLEDIQS